MSYNDVNDVLLALDIVVLVWLEVSPTFFTSDHGRFSSHEGSCWIPFT